MLTTSFWNCENLDNLVLINTIKDENMKLNTTITKKLNYFKGKLISKVINDYKAPMPDFVDDLLEEIDLGNIGDSISVQWKSYANQLISSFKYDRPEEFLRFPIVQYTMHANQIALAADYFNYICSSDKFTPFIQNGMTESPVGKPFLTPFYPLSSPLLIQHAYHFIRLLESTGLELLNLQQILEFGGGYGSFFRFLKNIGYQEKYFIYDIPIMCSFQKFYLKNVYSVRQHKHTLRNLEWLSEDAKIVSSKLTNTEESLFFATWSFSECPYELRESFEPIISNFKYVLFSYQQGFDNYENVKYFNLLERKLSEFRWKHLECPVYKGQFYLIGEK